MPPGEERPARFPDIELDDLRLVPFAERHLTDRYVSWLNDPAVIRFSEQRHRTHTMSSCTDYFLAQRESLNYFPAIEVSPRSDRHIGNMGVIVDAPNALAEMSILIGERGEWGKGIGCRAWVAVLDELLGPMGFRKVVAGTMEANVPMIRVFERSGMVVEAVTLRQFLWNGEETGFVQAAAYADRSRRSRQ